jgi:hypothetical protein
MFPIRRCAYKCIYYVAPRAHCAKCATRGGSFAGMRPAQSEIPNSSLTPGAPPACESGCFCAAHYCFAVVHNFPRGAPANARSHCAARNYGYSARASERA